MSVGGQYGILLRTNTLRQFLIAEKWEATVHVYDNNGMFQFSFNPQTDDAKTQITIFDLVTEDVSENIYLLVNLYNGTLLKSSEVQVLNQTAHPRYKFPVRGWNRLIVSGSKLVILGAWEAHVYNQNGEFYSSFEFFKSDGDKVLADCTATYDGRILITHDKGDFSDFYCVHVFTTQGQEIAKFRFGVGLNLNRMFFSPRSAGEHVVIAGYNGEDGIITVVLYTVDGNRVRRILLCDKSFAPFRGLQQITVTTEGYIAVSDYEGKIVVFKN